MPTEPEFANIPNSADAAREEAAMLDAWFADLQARLAVREQHVARRAFLNGYVASREQETVENAQPLPDDGTAQ